ncbi:IclR family transcriptional regulator [Bacillus chungangensis]|uniref:DNA-binding IclR family transcriptional regulator n=1 Tax=Bacillus chungangensis TaxID=587633 RepID=A0ABT9WTI0_9BACI|nr:IclR family transcriptional regulator [Bacillus chungangensis]MDQ0176419.1 DNA-binding IclR family transcriptional regulator [Bacillus chungangensis]
MQNKNKTVVKSMDVLNLFLTYSKLSFNEIVQVSGIPKTSVYRMIGSLEEMGFLQKDETGKYSLGLSFLQFGHLVAERLDIRQIALPIMETLQNNVGKAINLIIRDGNEAIYIEKLDTNEPVRLYTAIGRRSPLYAGACSRIILAYLSDKEIDHYLETTELKPLAAGTITDKNKLQEILKTARRNGYTISHSELENHTTSVAAPIFNYKGEVIAGLSIASIDLHFQKENLPQYIEKVKTAATEISQNLGFNVNN